MKIVDVKTSIDVNVLSVSALADCRMFDGVLTMCDVSVIMVEVIDHGWMRDADCRCRRARPSVAKSISFTPEMCLLLVRRTSQFNI
jgi:hypothetical protein